jgi:hypothetical protein
MRKEKISRGSVYHFFATPCKFGNYANADANSTSGIKRPKTSILILGLSTVPQPLPNIPSTFPNIPSTIPPFPYIAYPIPPQLLPNAAPQNAAAFLPANIPKHYQSLFGVHLQTTLKEACARLALGSIVILEMTRRIIGKQEPSLPAQRVGVNLMKVPSDSYPVVQREVSRVAQPLFPPEILPNPPNFFVPHLLMPPVFFANFRQTLQTVGLNEK